MVFGRGPGHICTDTWLIAIQPPAVLLSEEIGEVVDVVGLEGDLDFVAGGPVSDPDDVEEVVGGLRDPEGLTDPRAHWPEDRAVNQRVSLAFLATRLRDLYGHLSS